MLIPAGPALSTSGTAIKDLIARVARLGKNIILSQLGRDVCGCNLQLPFLRQRIVSALNSSFRRAKLRHKIRHKNFVLLNYHTEIHKFHTLLMKMKDLYFERPWKI